MNTFLPYDDFKASARSMDFARLNKQVIECNQLMNGLVDKSQPYAHHPATIMWEQTPEAIVHYAVAFCVEYRRRTGKVHHYEPIYRSRLTSSWRSPWWLGNEKFHASNRSVLLHKVPEHYTKRYSEPVPPIKQYVWPVHAVRWKRTPEGIRLRRSKWIDLPFRPYQDGEDLMLDIGKVGENYALYLLEQR